MVRITSIFKESEFITTYTTKLTNEEFGKKSYWINLVGALTKTDVEILKFVYRRTNFEEILVQQQVLDTLLKLKFKERTIRRRVKKLGDIGFFQLRKNGNIQVKPAACPNFRKDVAELIKLWGLYHSYKVENKPGQPKKSEVKRNVLWVLSQVDQGTIGSINREYGKHFSKVHWKTIKNNLEDLTSEDLVEKRHIGKRTFFKLVKQKKIQEFNPSDNK